tara:strand:+ start:1363 stop:1959 length:597 start_codon:yes stop_codon:yes gene_type:complete
MNKKRAIKLLLLWLATFIMAGIVSVLIYVQMAVNQENVAVSLEIEPPETEAENISIEQVGEETEIEPKPGAVGTADISEDTEFSHLVETPKPYWEVFPISSSGVSADNWHTILVQNRFKIDHTITPLSKRDWHLVRINNSIRVQFHSEMEAVKDILSRKKRGKFSIQLISIEDDRFPIGSFFDEPSSARRTLCLSSPD